MSHKFKKVHHTLCQCLLALKTAQCGQALNHDSNKDKDTSFWHSPGKKTQKKTKANTDTGQDSIQ